MSRCPGMYGYFEGRGLPREETKPPDRSTDIERTPVKLFLIRMPGMSLVSLALILVASGYRFLISFFSISFFKLMTSAAGKLTPDSAA